MGGETGLQKWAEELDCNGGDVTVAALNNDYNGGDTTRHNSASDAGPWLKFLREPRYAQ